jgi:hypothetical protein
MKRPAQVLIPLRVTQKEYDTLQQAIVRYGRISQLNNDHANDKICRRLLDYLEELWKENSVVKTESHE